RRCFGIGYLPSKAAPHYPLRANRAQPSKAPNRRKLVGLLDHAAVSLVWVPKTPWEVVMAFSLYAAVVPSYQQILEAVSGLLVKAESFCAEKGIAPPELIQARLAPDMLPFAYQVK